MFKKKATNTSKAINTSFLSASSKTFFNFCHERFFNDALAKKHQVVVLFVSTRNFILVWWLVGTNQNFMITSLSPHRRLSFQII